MFKVCPIRFKVCPIMIKVPYSRLEHRVEMVSKET
jgi:hypothetical protein